MKLPHFENYDQRHPWSGFDGLANAIEHGTAVVHKVTRTFLEKRASSTCQPGNNSPECEKPTDSTNTQTLPIVLGAVIPITCAIIVFVFLHRRNKKKQAIEDANDPHKSLDFGVEAGGGPSRKNRRGLGGRRDPIPQMTISDLGPDPMRPNTKQRGLSMDLDMVSNPYLLPAGLQGSGESLHSMSRSVQDEHDPYRPVTFMRASGEGARSPRPFHDNGSMYSASTVQTGNEKSSLMANARPMSRSYPKRGDSRSLIDAKSSEDISLREMHSTTRTTSHSTSHSRKTSLTSTPSLPNISQSRPMRKDSRKEPPPPISTAPVEAVEEHVRPPRTSSRPPRKSSMAASSQAVDRHVSDASFYGDDLPPPPPPPKVMEPEDWSNRNNSDSAGEYFGRFSIDTPNPSQQFPIENNRMSMMGVRPLPPDHPEENPEQRANRIRSFYKEYFDASRPNPTAGYYEDVDESYLDTAYYDPGYDDHAYPQAPYAQPMARRAMTPPPRGAASFQGGDHARHFSTMSGGQAPFRGRPAQRAPPKKKLPPPKALASLPTPHLLTYDTVISSPIDFAPPTSFRETQNGRRPDSPMGIQRTYSPSVQAYSPLVPSFEELNVMPSPHHLRKSGTFSSLDFAPPKFRGQDGTASDAGSIRSARSGISAVQMDAVRAGAYRVSRIPKEFVTSREDLSTQLRPTMNLTRPA